jgi:hypothetical protein
MKLKKAAAGLLFFGLGSTSLAVAPPLDRPSPPPCCADGRCYSNPMSCGFYATRWRRWPLESLETTSAGQLGPPAQQGGDFPVIEPPLPGEEDRKAPPPTAPQEPARAQPSNSGPAGSEGAPPAAGPAMQPNEQPPGGPLRSLPPYEPQVPNKSLNDTGPTTDSDPPPALPFGPRAIEAATPVREARQVPTVLPFRRPAPAQRNAPNDDPPPSLPAALAAASR